MPESFVTGLSGKAPFSNLCSFGRHKFSRFESLHVPPATKCKVTLNNISNTIHSPLQVVVHVFKIYQDRQIDNHSSMPTYIVAFQVHNTAFPSQQEHADKGHLFGFAACYATSCR